MIEIKYCPSTLAEGYDTYSPQAVKRLFDGKRVSPFLDFNINELKQSDAIVKAMQRISVSGVQASSWWYLTISMLTVTIT